MPEAFLGDGLIYEELLPVAWTLGPLAEGLLLARLNADNHQLLGAESSLDEVRVHEALRMNPRRCCTNCSASSTRSTFCCA
jgi:hypothetical protein